MPAKKATAQEISDFLDDINWDALRSDEITVNEARVAQGLPPVDVKAEALVPADLLPSVDVLVDEPEPESYCPFRHLDVRKVPRDDGVFFVPDVEGAPEVFEEVHLIIVDRCVPYVLTLAQIEALVEQGAIPVTVGWMRHHPDEVLPEVEGGAMLTPERCDFTDPASGKRCIRPGRRLTLSNDLGGLVRRCLCAEHSDFIEAPEVQPSRPLGLNDRDFLRELGIAPC